MNGLDYYNRQKEDWSDKELQDVRTEYETNEMTISQIADIHHRTPGSISYKLKNLGLVTHNTLSRGYLDYKNSKLYKEIVETGKSKDTDKEYPYNTGQLWTDEEEILLLDELDKNIDIESIAKRHKRTTVGINARRREIAYKLYCKNISIEEIIMKTKLDKDYILRIIKRGQNDSKRCKSISESMKHVSIESEMYEMKREIADLKKDVKEILRLMNALYEFESQ